MPSRKQSGAASAGRVQALLARPPGWVPPPEPGDAAGDVRAEVAPTAVRDDGQACGDGEGQRLAPGSAGPDEGTGDAGAAGRTPQSGVAALLPAAVRTGRLDPGRRGAVALVLAALLAALVAGGVQLRGRPEEVLVPQVLSSGAPLPGASASAETGGPDGPGGAAEVVVAVAGKVARPGLVRLPAGSRVDDAVRAAGGPVPGASPGLLNLARRLVDGEQVLVGVEPAPGTPVTASGATASGAGAAGGLLDLNTATVTDLDDLPGIGPVLAQRILDWRTEHQRFASVDQLREVTGIGEAKYQDLKAQVTV